MLDQKGLNDLGRGNHHFHDICCLRSFCALNDIELDAFPLLQRFESFPLERRVMHKDIISCIQADKTKPLSVVEPLNRTFSLHKTPPFLNGHAVLRDRTEPRWLNIEKNEEISNGKIFGEGMGGVFAKEQEVFTRPILVINREACTTRLEIMSSRYLASIDQGNPASSQTQLSPEM